MKIRWVAPCIHRALLFALLSIFFSTIALFASPQPDTGESLAKEYTMGKKYHDRVALIETGEEGARIRLDLVETAQTSVDIAYYTLTRGRFTDAFLSCLLAAADRGVHIRILGDGLTSIAYERKELKEALRGFETHPNIEVRQYEKFSLLRPWAWQGRLHEKLIIVDGKLALIGGRNIGDKYFLKEEYQQRFVHDREALVYNEGAQTSVIGDMQLYFDQVWRYKHTKAQRRTLTPEQGERFNQRLREHYGRIKGEKPELFQGSDWNQRTYPSESTRFVHNPLGRGKKEPWCLATLLQFASRSRSSIFIQSPYIIPTKSMQTLARQYDIDMALVTILTNAKRASPNPIAMAGYYNHRKAIVDKVAQVHEYQGPGSIHSKSYIIDDSISFIGTFNLDSRSSYINTESMLIIECERFAAELQDEIQVYMARSIQVCDDYTYGEVAQDSKPLWLFSKFVGLFEYYL